MEHVRILRLYLRQARIERLNLSIAINWKGTFTKRYQSSLKVTAWQILRAAPFFPRHFSAPAKSAVNGRSIPIACAQYLLYWILQVDGRLPLLRLIQILEVVLSSFHNLIRRWWIDKYWQVILFGHLISESEKFKGKISFIRREVKAGDAWKLQNPWIAL